MDPREQRAIIIAAMCRLERKGGVWFVPSQSAAEKKYTVDPAAGTCTCPDCEAGFLCKHVRAVRITLRRDLGMDGTVTETKTIVFEEKKTYKQNWPAYNAAQSCEKERVLALLHDLCQGIPEPPHPVGRKPTPLSDAAFALAYKVYGGFSARRFSSDLRDAHERGYVSQVIPGLKVPQFFESATFTPILEAMISKSAAPLGAVESTFAVDSSGFASTRHETWYDHKYGVERRKCEWVKVHIACGVKTNVVTAVRILDKDAADSPQFRPLVRETAENFTIKEVCADKAY